jgi:hypothetical protein
MNATLTAPYGQQVEYIGDDVLVQHTSVVETLPFTKATRVTHFRVSSRYDDSTKTRQLESVQVFSPLTGCWEPSTSEARSKRINGASVAKWIREGHATKHRDVIYIKDYNEDAIVLKCQDMFDDFLEDEGITELQDENPGAKAIGDIILCRMECQRNYWVDGSLRR